jgi:Tfp pilus assembly protein PilO|tara:strand:+ start:177 stop:752 length:576 start_codon:yes stop_codon:yes gene_type:complete
MNKLNPKTRFIIFLITTLIVVGGFGWYNYGIYSDINEAKKTIKDLAAELKNQDQVRNSILEAQNKREENISDLKQNVFFTMREYELAAVRMKELAKKHDIDVLSLNLRSNNTFPDLNNYAKVKKVPIERLHINLRLSGEFLGIGPFFDEVEQEIKLVNLHSYKFSLDKNAAKQVIADVVYYAYQMEEEKSE